MGFAISKCLSQKTGKPLKTYESEPEAKCNANYLCIVHKHEMAPYYCGRCSKWHLAPKESHTPSIPCYWCTGRDGKNKDLYPSERVALRRALIIEQRTPIRLRAYKCPHAEGWHLTSK